MADEPSLRLVQKAKPPRITGPRGSQASSPAPAAPRITERVR